MLTEVIIGGSVSNVYFRKNGLNARIKPRFIVFFESKTSYLIVVGCGLVGTLDVIRIPCMFSSFCRHLPIVFPRSEA